MCTSGQTCHAMDCCFSELALYKNPIRRVDLVQTGHRHHFIECNLFSPWYSWILLPQHAILKVIREWTCVFIASNKSGRQQATNGNFYQAVSFEKAAAARWCICVYTRTVVSMSYHNTNTTKRVGLVQRGHHHHHLIKM
jgi:predicted transcriptional regulator